MTRLLHARTGSVGVAVAFGLMLVVGAASPLGAEAGERSELPDPNAVVTGSASGPAEGIEVHGHWTIEVRDPDGTLVERREFENAFLGSSLLVEILGRSSTPGDWEIMTDSLTKVCEQPAGTPTQHCRILEPTGPGTGNNMFKNLVVTVVGTNLELAGSLIAQLNGTIDGVNTSLHNCLPSVAPENCPGAGIGGANITQSPVSPAIAVQAGQQVQVNVVISFS
jgi:hypothetical protein